MVVRVGEEAPGGDTAELRINETRRSLRFGPGALVQSG